MKQKYDRKSVSINVYMYSRYGCYISCMYPAHSYEADYDNRSEIWHYPDLIP